MDTKITKHVRLALTLFAPVLFLSALVLILNLTSPITAGPAGILAVLLFFYAFMASVLFAVLVFVLAVGGALTGKKRISDRLSLRLATVLAVGPVFIVALNTLGSIGFIEVGLVIVLVGLACFYVIRRGYDQSDL